MEKKNLKISFCIVSMNRLHQLKETLLRNIADNADYPDLEVILLNYNSADGMEEWVKEALGDHIATGRIVYYKTPDPSHFRHSHAKNLAFKLSNGDIICSINADHFAGKGFARYVNNAFMQDPGIVLTTIDYPRSRPGYMPAKDVLGKVCVSKRDFLKIKGFEERMKSYGFEDYDLVNRLEMAGIKRVLIEDLSFLHYIPHDEEDRYNMEDVGSYTVYIHHISTFLSEIIFLGPHHHYRRYAVTDNFSKDADNCIYAYKRRLFDFQFTLEDPDPEEGVWQDGTGAICFSPDRGKPYTLYRSGTQVLSVSGDKANGAIFHRLTHLHNLKSLLNFNYLIPNRCFMEKNVRQKVIAAGSDNYGNATVYRNFDASPLYIP